MRAVNAAYGTTETVSRVDTADVLDFATLQGARVNGLEKVAGSLTRVSRRTCSSSARRT